ncbi:GtrA family protein [Mucilaginibacter sp.]
MSTFIKAQASSIISTGADLLTTVICKEFLGIWYVAASFIGTFVGGATNFGLGRRWVFDGRHKKVPVQLVKYLITWSGNLLLTTSGVFIITHYCGISYFISKIIVAVTVGIFYNYMLQKRFVFA